MAIRILFMCVACLCIIFSYISHVLMWKVMAFIYFISRTASHIFISFFLWEGQVEDALGAVMFALKGFVHFKWLYSADTKCAPTTKKSAYLIFVIWASFRMRTCAFLLYKAIRKITCNEYLIIFYIYIPRWAFVSNLVRCFYV